LCAIFFFGIMPRCNFFCLFGYISIQEGEMPPAIYLPMHLSAQLTAPEKQ